MGTEKPLTLQWCELKEATKIGIVANPNHPGVYIWGFNIDGVFIPYYVGIAGKIISRIGEHASSILGGGYRVYHKNSLADFKKYKHLKTYKVENEEGLVYYPNLPNSLKSFTDENERKVLMQHVEFMIDTLQFSYAEVSGKEYSLKEIEKICITKIGINNLGNERGGYSTAYNIIHEGCPTIVSIFR